MLNNRINLLVCFGVLILTIPMLLIGVVFEELRQNDFNLDPIEGWHIQVFGAIVFSIITSVSLMLRWKHSRLLTNVLLLFIAVIFGVFMYNEIGKFTPKDIVPVAISLFIYLALLFGFLFINSEFIRPFYEREIFIKRMEEEAKDILDA